MLLREARRLYANTLTTAIGQNLAISMEEIDEAVRYWAQLLKPHHQDFSHHDIKVGSNGANSDKTPRTIEIKLKTRDQMLKVKSSKLGSHA